MSDLDELAEGLGVDVSEQEEEAKSPIAVDTAKQIENSDKLVSECKEIYKQARENDLTWRWDIGQRVDEAYANEDSYEKSVLKRLSEELDIAVSDLSRFRKFFNSFDKDMLLERAQVGYSWSHFKMINDISDDSIKKRMIAMMEQEDEAPKTKELQSTIAEEKDQSFAGLDEDAASGSSSSGESSSSSGKSYIKPVNSAMMALEKLCDHLGDIALQEEGGMDFDTDAKEEKYNEAMDELGSRLKEISEIHAKLWGSSGLHDKTPQEGIEE